MRYRTACILPGDPPKESLIDPYHVANLKGEWYLFGVHTGQTEIRQFSMARIERATVTPRSFELPPGFDPDTLLADTFGRFACAKRSHQIRLHLATLGHQILGDPLYADPTTLAADRRLCLHATTLSIHHPDDDRPITWHSPCPF